MVQQCHFWLCIQRKLNHSLKEMSALPYSLQHRNSQGMETTEVSIYRGRKVVIHTMEYYLTIKKEGNSAICNNMDKSQENYAK